MHIHDRIHHLLSTDLGSDKILVIDGEEVKVHSALLKTQQVLQSSLEWKI
ncbi:MAG: hypothetical protein HWD61_14225 [Parachlamydiaceae bacterium]|nr:MAG: hypothetical protein HWD61_14225 [Parachlamydiaceae bacterium]